MKATLFLSLTLLGTAVLQSAPFVNLDFDAANTNNVVFDSGESGIGTALDLLPGWQLFKGSEQVTSVLLNQTSLFDGVAAIVNHTVGLGEVDGRYALVIQGTPAARFSLVQFGDVPADAMTLMYGYKYVPFNVYADGVLLRNLNTTSFGFSQLQTSAAFDITPFAGQNVLLRFEQIPSGGPHDTFVDSIAFIVPEPEPIITLGLGSLATMLLLRRNHVRNVA